MSEQFTPGPWKVGGEWPQLVAVYDARCIYIAHANTGFTTERDNEWIGGNPLGRDVAIANARLIAAAPELYKACFDWIEWLSADDGSLSDVGADYETQMLDAMRAALAKAKQHA